MVVLDVPGEEAAEVLGVLDATETFGEIRLVIQGLEVSFRERVVVGGGGRLCDLVTPRLASIRAVVLAFMGPPRSAWRVRRPGGTL